MLNNRSLDDRTYEELLREALLQIPLYTEEWTNYNPSDPGITILENLTAFEVLQQNRLDQITPVIRQRLLKMAGFEAKKGRCARVLLAADGLREPTLLPMNRKFYVGNLCFETAKNQELLPCHLTGVHGQRDGQFYDYSSLLDREYLASASVFGKEPKKGDSLWFTMDGLPGPGEEIIFYITVADRHNRNPFVEKGHNTFAALRWECYTTEGFREINVRDDTGCFLINGEVRLRLPELDAAPCPQAPGGGYAIRAVLTRADYDVCPRLKEVDGFLFEAWQKDTRSMCHTFHKIRTVELSSDLLREGYITVFGKEEKGSSYRRYEPWRGQAGPGRYYEEEILEDGTYVWHFDKERFGFAPERFRNAVKVVVYSEEIMRRYSLGSVMGYDQQSIDLPAEHIVADSFCIIARREDENGEPLYDFVRPSRFGEGDLTYYLYENEGKVVIEDAGDFIGAELYVGTLCVTSGPEGNVRSGNRFSCAAAPGVRFVNLQSGTGGCFRETAEEVKERFLRDLRTPYTAVTAADYERLVMETPELCIHKARAFMDRGRNVVRIAVKPGTDEEFPELPETYRKAIEKQLEDKRLLTTKIEILPPVYAAVNVQGTIYVKRQYENNLQQVEEAIRRKIDYIHSDRNFGETLKFEQVFHEIEALDCVEFVYELSLSSQNPGIARQIESDIVPAQNCLLYAGEITLEAG